MKMNKRYKFLGGFMVCILILTSSFGHLVMANVITRSQNNISNEVKPITDTKDKLEGLTEEEKVVLEKLFTLTQEIDEMEKEEDRITSEFEILQLDANKLEAAIQDKEKNYENQLYILEKVLIGYQRRGPASYIDTLLGAGDLKTFVRSLNIIREFTQNTSKLLEEVEEKKIQLTKDKVQLEKSLIELENKKEELKVSLVKKLQLKKEQEIYLESLEEQQIYYSNQLENIEQAWVEIKVLFSELVGEFTRIIGEGNLTMEDLNISIGFPIMSGAIKEETFNTMLNDNSTLPEMLFHFNTDQVIIEVPEVHLTLTGIFQVEEKHILSLHVLEGSFYDMPLEETSIAELFRGGTLRINMKELAGDMVVIDFTIKSVELKDGYLSFQIIPKLF